MELSFCGSASVRLYTSDLINQDSESRSDLFEIQWAGMCEHIVNQLRKKWPGVMATISWIRTVRWSDICDDEEDYIGRKSK